MHINTQILIFASHSSLGYVVSHQEANTNFVFVWTNQDLVSTYSICISTRNACLRTFYSSRVQLHRFAHSSLPLLRRGSPSSILADLTHDRFAPMKHGHKVSGDLSSSPGDIRYCISIRNTHFHTGCSPQPCCEHSSHTSMGSQFRSRRDLLQLAQFGRNAPKPLAGSR